MQKGVTSHSPSSEHSHTEPRETSLPKFEFEYPHSCYGVVVQSTKNSNKLNQLLIHQVNLCFHLIVFQNQGEEVKEVINRKVLVSRKFVASNSQENYKTQNFISTKHISFEGFKTKIVKSKINGIFFDDENIPMILNFNLIMLIYEPIIIQLTCQITFILNLLSTLIKPILVKVIMDNQYSGFQKKMMVVSC
ncbi:unnamed protein product (macronuclear) [Paramecium tetraurelia]|uniref:Uncharacterized protein n=1 Tax=Paramecium tetraurelia TaxID=5888 RepID=A0C7P4_PARTE|nr:uncharacterized protein GSPATT00035941001 [Paramecium tetraurelia]CAK66811.1 unnamed protein product [Paramecium tetraurelia]|eukprot:XP_001434208.1 hypothetical protein (macronuclear) [Paramecium tetraurelia strain d4-2]